MVSQNSEINFSDMQPSCPTNIYTEHCRKIPNNFTAFLETFLFLKTNDSVFLIELFIYFQGKKKFSHYLVDLVFSF